ncbi:hypothetical protein LEMLEM_LOCUS17375 [Lemmus lemmus]
MWKKVPAELRPI